MRVSSVNSLNFSSNPQVSKKHKRNYVKITGYASLGFGLASGILALNKKIKAHKYLAYASGIFAIIHTGIIEYYNFKRKHKI